MLDKFKLETIFKELLREIDPEPEREGLKGVQKTFPRRGKVARSAAK